MSWATVQCCFYLFLMTVQPLFLPTEKKIQKMCETNLQFDFFSFLFVFTIRSGKKTCSQCRYYKNEIDHKVEKNIELSLHRENHVDFHHFPFH